VVGVEHATIVPDHRHGRSRLSSAPLDRTAMLASVISIPDLVAREVRTGRHRAQEIESARILADTI
jgi:hypothetical protein